MADPKRTVRIALRIALLTVDPHPFGDYDDSHRAASLSWEKERAMARVNVMRKQLFLVGIMTMGLGAPAWAAAPDALEAPVAYYRYKIIKSYPHDTRSFTQGLVYQDGFLYEGTGLYGQSVLTKCELKSGRIIKKSRLPRKYFGEGIALFGDKIIQLTWKSRKGFSYDRETFRLLGEFSYNTKGWGLTHDGTRLILSDGTDTLRFLDPNSFAETGRIRVRHNGRPLRQINELEFIDGQIYANILPTDYIAIIAPQTGRVTGLIDLRGLYTPPPRSPSDTILNGIAYIPENKHLLVTGKRWPKMHEIELVPHTITPQ